MTIERRVVRDAEVQFRAKDGDKGPGITGHAAVFNEQYVLWEGKGYRVLEIVKPGTFTRALKENQDIRCLFNHDPNNLLGRTAAGTLALRQDKVGLQYECDLPDTQMGRDVGTLVQRKDVTGCSFGFTVTKQSSREETKDGVTTYTREIEDVDLFDASPVTYPAYTGTDVKSRSHAMQHELRSAVLSIDGLPAEIREQILAEDHRDDVGECSCKCEACKRCKNRSARKKKNDSGPGSNTQCQCSCDPCQTGDCANCSNADYDGDHDGIEDDADRAAAELDEVDTRLRLAGMKPTS